MEETEERDDTTERAMEDTHLAAELVMSLSRPPANDLKLKLVYEPLQWSRRKPRSRQIDLAGINKSKGVVEVDEEEEEKPARASPKSPLSWSGGDAPENGGAASGGRAEKRKSMIDVSKVKRLKITIGGRSKKKLSLAELKEEENTLLLENLDLHKKLEELRTNYDELRKINLSLKEKFKMYLDSQPTGMNTDAAASSPLPMALPHPSSSKAAAPSPEQAVVMVQSVTVVGTSSQLPMALPSLSSEAAAAAPERVMAGIASSSSRAVASSSRNAHFRLPDLNMIPEPEA